MNYAKIGQIVKSKHSEYNDLPDDVVGKKIVAKYPEYKDLGENTFEKIIDSPLFPVLGGLLGGIGGLILAPATLGQSIPFGAMGGAGAGYALRSSLGGLSGIPQPSSSEDFLKALETVGVAGGLGEVAAMGRAASDPQRTLGEARATFLGDKDIQVGEDSAFHSGVLDKLTNVNNRFYHHAGEAIQNQAKTRLIEFSKTLSRLGERLKLSDIYRELPAFEDSAGAYTPKGKTPTEATRYASNLISHAAREFLREEGGLIPRTITGTMSALERFGPYASWVKKGALGGAAAAGIGTVLWKLLGGGGDSVSSGYPRY